MSNGDKTLISIKQAVEKFKEGDKNTFSDYMLRQLARQGKIPYVRLGSKIFFIYEDILDWLEIQSQANVKADETKEYGTLRRIGG